MRLILSFLFVFTFTISWTQTTNTITTLGPGSFIVPAGVTNLDVACWGGGGAGGGVNAVLSVFGGGGGGGGAYSKVSLPVTAGSVLNYTVGTGGVGANGSDGPNGGATNFSTVIANGGLGGKNGNSSNGGGGAGGAASGVGTFYSGGNGEVGKTLSAILSSGGGGGGAGTVSNGNNASSTSIAGGIAVTGGGAGGSGKSLTSGGGVGNPGGFPGGGGGGALGLLFSNLNGGSGGNGQIIISYTCPTISTTGIINSVCKSSNPQTAFLPYTSTVSISTSYSIDWNSSAEAVGIIDQGNTSFTFSASGGAINTIAIPATSAAGTFFGIITFNNNTCTTTQPIQITINPTPTAPIKGTLVQPTCAVPTGSVILTGLPTATPSNDLLISQSGTVSTTYSATPIAAGTYTISGLAPGTYNFTSEYTGSCVSPLLSNIVINPLVTNTYNAGWSNGTPTTDQNIVFASNYTTAGSGAGNLSGCSCTVNSGVSVSVSSDDTLSIMNAVVNNGGTLTFENNSSLLQTNNIVNTGNITYKRNTTPVRRYDFSYWSSPVAGIALNIFSPNTLSDKYFSYDSAVDDWHEELPTALMIVGKGYIIRAPQTNDLDTPTIFPGSFSGIPNNGNISGETVNYPGIDYLVGNPYPSALDADKFLLANNAILQGTIYLWTHNTARAAGVANPGSGVYAYTSDDYASYNGVGGTATIKAPSSATGGVNTNIPSGKIAAGQSFLATAKATGTITFTNSMRIGGTNNSQFFKSSKTADIEKHRLWLDLSNNEGAFKQTLVGYVTGATNDYEDQFDGISIDGNDYIDFYSVNEGTNFAIQGRSLPFDDTDEVPLGFKTIIAGDFTISIDQADGDLATQTVYLEDKLTNTINDLTAKDYTFTTNEGTFDDRFVLKYKDSNKTLKTSSSQKDNTLIVSIQNKILNITSSSDNISKVVVYDLSGKELYKKDKVASSTLTIQRLHISNQILVVKVILDNGHSVIRKII